MKTKDQLEAEIISSLLELGLICVFKNSIGLEVRGYRNQIALPEKDQDDIVHLVQEALHQVLEYSAT